MIELPLDIPGSIGFDDDGVLTERTVLPCGIRVITQNVPGQKSVALGIGVGVGSRDERPGTEGSTHFLEHLMFKGTDTRSAEDISALGDYLGGTLNAATSRTYTVYYGRVFQSDLPQLLELLVDMIARSTLKPEDMELERQVILEELAASDDDVAQVAETEIQRLVMGSHPQARPIGGTHETVTALDHEHLVEHYRANYHAGELVVSAAGAVNHQELCAMVSTLVEAAGWQLPDRAPVARRKVADVVYTAGCEEFMERPGRQSAVVVGMPGKRLSDKNDSVLAALETILGGGQSSRLFREVREKRGLAYSTYAWSASYHEGGIFAMSAQCAPESTQKVAQIMGDCLDEIASDGVSAEEVETAFRQRRARLIFAIENTSFRRSRIAFAETVRGSLRTIDEVLDQAREVTAEDIQACAQECAARARSVMTVGPAR
ncbi:M16 family metallopeptidase [Trueperella bialowiezensis]|uniref:Protease 3 n=1 Tax=Trueperella bialowiezensis TaxID=312285 RepID=A0A3S4YWW8_9ACTO|nr:pitrilysin family protein [Trueperella bialowiezensis]VEI12640.1 Protease 3 precursor [Trueperella bialowiezensis]